MKYLYLLIPILFVGCGTKIEYVTKIQEVEKVVPIYPEVPEIECDFYKPTSEEVLNSLYECVIKQKRLLDSLKKK